MIGSCLVEPESMTNTCATNWDRPNRHPWVEIDYRLAGRITMKPLAEA